jgi:ABC-2 type transport system permease protein/lipopolysaccharide transport system permease protein
MCVAAMDTLIAVSGLAVLFVVFQEVPKITSLWLPVLLAVQIAFTLGVTLAASITIVYLRDLRYALPVILQFGLFATPVAYSLADVPEKLRPWMVGLNPLAAVIDGYRRTVLYGQAPHWELLGVAAATSAVVLFGGYALFKRFETGIADVA